MRNEHIGVWESILLVIVASVVLIVAGLTPSLAAEDAKATSVAAATPDADDYYTRRAKGLIAAEKSAAAKPHPLAASYPGMDVVVCEAGCPDRTVQVIYVRPQNQPAIAAREAHLEPTSAHADERIAAADIECVGGCYGDRDTAPVPAPARAQAPTLRIPPLSETITRRDALSPIR